MSFSGLLVRFLVKWSEFVVEEEEKPLPDGDRSMGWSALSDGRAEEERSGTPDHGSKWN